MPLFERDTDIALEVARGTSAEPPFYEVSIPKLSALSIATFGLYEVYWFYKNWSRVKEQSGRDISPFWRAFFAPLFCHAFATHVRDAGESMLLAPRIAPGLLAVTYFCLVAVSRAPDPFDLISLVSFLPLIPIARQIREIHGTLHPGVRHADGWSMRSWLVLGIGSIVVGFTVLAAFGPPTGVLRESEIPLSYRRSLAEAGVLFHGERMRFFYSGALFSILDDGNLLTDERVISYETVDGNLYIAMAFYEDISGVEVTQQGSLFADTVVTVTTGDGGSFVLILSAEDGRDKAFLAELDRLVRLARERAPAGSDG